MKYQTRLYYSVQNCGDGSAYPKLFESVKLCELDQEFQYEGWAEDCSGLFSVESDSPIHIVDHITTKEEVIEEIKELIEYETEKEKERLICHLKEVEKL